MEHQRAIRHILKDKTVQTEIFVAFKLFRQSQPTQEAAEDPTFKWHSPTHRCTERCPQFFHGNVCICQTFGNWHYCTQETCNEMFQTREHMVCPLSGNVYNLEFQMDDFGFQNADDLEEDQPQVAFDDYGTEETKTIQLPKKKKKKKQGVDIPSELLDVSLTEHRLQDAERQHELEEAKQRQEEESSRTEEEKEIRMDDEEEKPAPEEEEEEEEIDPQRNTGKLDDVHNRHSTFHVMLTSLFKEHPTALFNSIIANAERLWLIVHSSPEIKKKQFRYQPNYHILAILSCMCAGYKCSNKVVVPRDEWIKTHLPLTREMHKLPGIRPAIKVSPFTQTKKLFQLCIASVASKQQNIQWKA